LPVQITPEIKMMYNPEMKGVFMFVPGVIVVILMLVSALMTSISIAREKELGTMEVLMVSPLEPYQIILGKVMPYMLLAFINTLIVLSLGKFVFGVPIMGNIALLLAEAFLFISTALSLGILISTVAPNQQTAMMMSLMGLMLPTILLSGFIFPVSSMPWPLQLLSNIVPAKWFLHIIKNIMLKGAGIRYVWQETLILFGMATFFIFLSARRFKLKLG
jgi:ABC-2 type transport system permease protein